jgi:hypothetical protein
MQQLDVNDYRPPFITETDELLWDDCTVCSTLMASASATSGETVSRRDWSEMGRAELKALRERIRNYLGPDNQTGGTTMADMRVAFAKEYSWLPQIPSYEYQKNTWAECRSKLLNGWGGVWMGNPSLVSNQNSKLRRWTINDDFGHAIWVDRARKSSTGEVEFLVMDPLGRGTYDGDWVPEDELKEFTWIYAGSYVYVTLFKRGAWNAEARATESLSNKVNELEAEIDSLSSKNQQLSLQIANLTRENDKLSSQVESLSLSVKELDKKLAEAKKTITAKNLQIRTLQAKLEKCRKG